MNGCAYREYRCQACQKLLFKGILVEGEVEVRCRGCHDLVTIQANSANDLMCLIPNCPNRVSFTPQHHEEKRAS